MTLTVSHRVDLWFHGLTVDLRCLVRARLAVEDDGVLQPPDQIGGATQHLACRRQLGILGLLRLEIDLAGDRREPQRLPVVDLESSARLAAIALESRLAHR